MVSQAPRIFTHMSVLSNVAFPLRVRGVGRAEARAAALEQLRAVGIADLAHRRASDLSGGQAARVAIARALVFRPEVLILDEPTAALDPASARAIEALLQHWIARAPDRCAWVWITHDPEQAARIGQQHWRMEAGRLRTGATQ